MSSTKNPTRTKILNAAWHLIEAGESKTRMSDFAKAAGISRQAVYLHFPSRADLLIALTLHIDEEKDVDARLAPSRAATSGRDRLRAFVTAWTGYIPEIYGVGRALMAMQDTDEEAKKAWAGRMAALHHSCVAATQALAKDDVLRRDLTPETGADLLWTLLSVRNWEQLVQDAGWSQSAYEDAMQDLAAQVLTKDA